MNIIDKDKLNDHDLVMLDCGDAISVYDLYQAFKERMIIELTVKNNGSRTGTLFDRGNSNEH